MHPLKKDKQIQKNPVFANLSFVNATMMMMMVGVRMMISLARRAG